MSNYLVTSQELIATADAIREKTGSDELVIWNEDLGFANAIDDIPSGGSLVEEKIVNFIDYDGTILYSYTAEEFAELEELPDLVNRDDRLVATDWNWSITSIRNYLTHYPGYPIWVGQLYNTKSGKTELDVEIPEERKSLGMSLALSGEVSIDWGDGSDLDYLTGTGYSVKSILHNYPSGGKYTILIDAVDGLFAFKNGVNPILSYPDINISSTPPSPTNLNLAYSRFIRHIRIGPNFQIKTSAFRNLGMLETLTLPEGTSMGGVETYIFNALKLLKTLILPRTVSKLGDYAVQYCSSLETVSLSEATNEFRLACFGADYALKNISIPYADSSFAFGNNIFNSLSSLVKIAIPISSAGVAQTMLSDCGQLIDVCIAEGNTTIGQQAFSGCGNIISIIIPASITTIRKQAFYNMYAIKEFHFRPSTPPTLASTDVFSGVPGDFIIYVPYSEDHSVLEAYKTASNWSTFASMIVEEPAPSA